MTRRRAVSAFVSLVFLSLITMTVHSMYSGSEVVEESEPVSFSVALVDTETNEHSRAFARHASIEREESSSMTEAPDSGVDEVFVRALRECIRTDCATRVSSGDGGVAYLPPLPPPPPKDR